MRLLLSSLTLSLVCFFTSPSAVVVVDAWVVGNGRDFASSSSSSSFRRRHAPTTNQLQLQRQQPLCMAATPAEVFSQDSDSLKELCRERNIPFDSVKNARDLASSCRTTTSSTTSTSGAPKTTTNTIQPGRLYRMGRVSDATERDQQILLRELGIKTLIDLRSPTELKDDPALYSPVYKNFTNMIWKEARKEACVKELDSHELVVKPRRNKKEHNHNNNNNNNNPFARILKKRDVVELELDDEVVEDRADDDDDHAMIIQQEDEMEEFKSRLETTTDEELCGLDCDEDFDSDNEEAEKKSPKKRKVQKESQVLASYNGDRRERHFVSLMNEFKYVKGTVSKVRKRDLTKALLKSPGALVSRRVRSSVKKPFLDEINDGGLPMLNDLLLRYGKPGIRYVLEVCADRKRHPVAFYCTAGKDRTGMIAALILAICGVDLEDIVQDYSLSANVYAEMNDHKAMVGALSQRNIDPKTFLTAPPGVMKQVFKEMEENYGSVEGYCDWIGFGPEQRQRLREACMKE